jgi:NAD(P)-dependent dehydrogenase (short-subunit alcohol dehydrogenase family)
MFEEALAAFARLDILVNNAGTQVWKPLVDLEEMGPRHRHQFEGLLFVHAARGAPHAAARRPGRRPNQRRADRQRRWGA